MGKLFERLEYGQFLNDQSKKRQLSLLPSQISFNRLAISGTPVVIARREIFDIRAQLMAEDTADHDNLELIAGLEKGDLKPHFYEGGFKTWECSLDLAKLVASQDAILESLADLETDIHIIEVCAVMINLLRMCCLQEIYSLELALQSHPLLSSLISLIERSLWNMPTRNENCISPSQTTTMLSCVLSRSQIYY